MMTLEKFWEIIDTANEGADHDIAIVNENILEQLMTYELEDIILWHKIFEEYYEYTNGNQLHVAFYIVDGSYNQLAFASYRAGLIGTGKNIYMNILKNPDSLVDYEFIENNVMLNAALPSVAKIAYIMKNGATAISFDELADDVVLSGKMKKEIFDSIDFSMRMDNDWEDSERSLKRMCPNLFEKFW